MLHRKITAFPKGTTVDTINIQPGEHIHMDFAFYNVIYINGFTYMLIVVCKKTGMTWVLPHSSKRSSICIIRFILTAFKNKQQQ